MHWPIDERTGLLPVRADQPAPARSLPAGPDLPDLVPVMPEWPRGSKDPCAWLSSDLVTEPCTAWRRAAGEFDVTGLWPLLTGGWERPFQAGELAGPQDIPEAADVLRSGWAGTRLVRPDGTLLPQRAWPGLAPASGCPDGDTAVLPDPPGPVWAARLLLVPATRPADALAQLGWYGACNWSLTGADIAAVLRSWEDRFGAYVVRIGFAEFDLVVTRPPTDREQCLVLADEHYAFCPDNYAPQNLAEPVLFSREEYAEQLRGARVWHFWWD